MFEGNLNRAKTREKTCSSSQEGDQYYSQPDTLDKHWAQTIVRQYGEALQEANILNGMAAIALIKKMANDEKLRKEVENSLRKKKGEYYDLFCLKSSKSLLPYPKETIKEAIELLLQYDKDPDNIWLLKEGLKYLEYFE